jgi:hypothetical protein
MDEDIRVAMQAMGIVSYKDCFDFSSMESCNYSYQNPVGQCLPTATSDAGIAVYADKNWSCDYGDGTNNPNPNCSSQPWWGTVAAGINEVSPFIEAAICTDDDDSSTQFTNQHQNSKNHDTDTQNVLFAGYNVERCDKVFVGVSSDNIYTRWFSSSASAIQKVKGLWGTPSQDYTVLSGLKERDSYLGN